MNSSTTSCGNPVRPKIGVTIGPGATAFTRIPRPTNSAALVRQYVLAERFCRSVKCVLATSCNDHASPFLLQTLCRRQPDTAVSAGYDRYFSLSSLHGVLRVNRLVQNQDVGERPFPGLFRLRYLDECRIRLHFALGGNLAGSTVEHSRQQFAERKSSAGPEASTQSVGLRGNLK
jgi:hypothetical protein